MDSGRVARLLSWGLVLLSLAVLPACRIVTESSGPRELRLRPPALLVRLDPTLPSRGLALHSLVADVEIIGPIATTTLELVYENPHERDLEGRFVLPLPPGASPCRFAMEVGGELREGVVVERERGRVIFEKIVRREVDPGLLEWVQGNAFQARVFPIPALGTKRLIVAYEEELTPLAGGGASCTLPLGYGEVTDRVEISARIAGVPGVVVDGGRLGRRVLTGASEPALLFFSTRAVRLDEDITLRFSPAPAGAEAFVAVEEGEEGPCFLAQLPVRSMPHERPLPQRIVLLWDASGSRARSDLGADLEALAEYLGDLGRASVHLLVFSNDVWLQEEHRITGGNAGPLIERLETLEPDGATSFGCLDLSDIEGPIDGVLLFSDGLETLSLGRPELEGRSVDVLTSASVVDRSLLEEMARGGVLLDLKAVSTEQAVDALFEEPLQFLGAESQGGSVLDLEPRAPRVVSGGFSVSGRLGGTTPTALTLRFGHGGEVTEMVEVPLDPAGSSIGGAFAPGRVERTWARARIGSLLSRREENEDAITELGKRLSLVTPYTSLIVLETLEDYLRYEVEPPEPLRDEYLEALATKREAEAVETSREERVEALRLEWEERLAWWEREPAPPLEPEPPAASRIGEGGSVVALSTAPGVDGIEPVEPSEVYSHSTIRLSEERVITTSGSDERHLPGLQERSSEVSDITSDHPDLRAPPLELDDDSGAPTGEDRVVVRSNDEAPSAVVESRFIDLQELGGPEIQGQQYSLAASFACGLDEEEDEDVEWEPLPETATHYGSPGGERSRGIRLQAWSPGSPQGQALREAGLGIYERYLELRPEHARSPAFLLDSADLLLAGGEPELAIRVLSNLAELDLESPRLLRVLGHRLGQIGALDVAEAVFREVLRLRPEEPQSQRDLGLALAQQEKWDEAILALEGVVLEHWDDRFPGIERLVLGELNDVIARCREATGRSSHTLPEELVDPLDVDLRIVCTWDADACDVDLWVTEPGGEKAYYEHQDTRIGGHMSPDFTRGYGPEEYLLRRAAPGVYKIQCHYYGDRQQTLHGSTTIQVLIIKNLGRPDEERTAVTRRLDEVGGVVDVAEVSFP